MQKRIYTILLPILLVLFLAAGCKSKNRQETENTGNTTVETPTESEKATAIKEMLRQGVSKAVGTLSSENGFFNSDSLVVSMPEDIQNIFDNIKKIPQGDQLVNNALAQINKVAGISAEPIGAIINAAIDSMSIEEANNLLLSDSAAATHYLHKIVRKPLHEACEPIIIQSFDKKIVGNITPRDTWMALADNYNKVANSKVGKIAKLQAAESELDGFITDKILDAVFYLIAKEEMNIRKHPATRISQSMAKTFGWLDKKQKQPEK